MEQTLFDLEYVNSSEFVFCLTTQVLHRYSVSSLPHLNFLFVSMCGEKQLRENGFVKNAIKSNTDNQNWWTLDNLTGRIFAVYE